MAAGIYIHVPFCVSKCPYCDFYSLPSQDEQLKEEYTQRLIDEMKRFAGVQGDTLYFGGGTPPLLGAERIARLIGAARKLFSLPDDCEITLEANPAENLEEVFAAFVAAGGNRLSLGMQSSHPDILKRLGRRHTPEQLRRAVFDAKSAGISNISLDMMLGVPGQRAEHIKKDVALCRELDVQHVSAYLLKIEAGTPFFAQQDSLCLPDEDTAADVYLEAVLALEQAGFAQYEISNFSKSEKQSRHNLKYWNSDPYLGFGPAAHSFFEGKRFAYSRDMGAFLNGVSPVEEENGDIPAGDPAEYAMLRLRLCEGLTSKGFFEKFGESIPHTWYQAAKKLPGYLVQADEYGIRFTPQGFLVSNGLIKFMICS